MAKQTRPVISSNWHLKYVVVCVHTLRVLFQQEFQQCLKMKSADVFVKAVHAAITYLLIARSDLLSISFRTHSNKAMSYGLSQT